MKTFFTCLPCFVASCAATAAQPLHVSFDEWRPHGCTYGCPHNCPHNCLDTTDRQDAEAGP